MMSQEIDKWVPFREGVNALGRKPGTFSYYVSQGLIRSRPGESERDHRYSLVDIQELKAKRKTRKYGNPYTIDWMTITDLPHAIALDLQVYRDEIIGDFNLYRAWLERNPHIAVCAFDKNDRRNIWAYVALLPLPEPMIWQVITGEKSENDVTADDILDYREHAGPISLLAISVVALPEHKALLYPVLDHFMTYFADLAPDQIATRIFAQAETPEGDMLMQKLHFSSIAVWDGGGLMTLPQVGVLDLARPGATRVVRRLQEMLAAKGVDLVNESFPVPSPPAPGGQLPPTPKKPEKPRPVNTSELPTGLVGLAAFSKAHGIHENTARKAGESGRLPVVKGSWKAGKAIVREALDTEGQARFYELYQGNERFASCPDCPHGGNQQPPWYV